MIYAKRRPQTKPVFTPHFGHLVNELFSTVIDDVVQGNGGKHNRGRKDENGGHFERRRKGRHFSDRTKAVPFANILENEESYSIELAAPGLTKEDFKIDLENEKLIVSVSNESTEEESKFTRREFNYSSFTRSFNLSEDIDLEQINANYTNGVLTIELAKKEAVETPRATSIEVK